MYQSKAHAMPIAYPISSPVNEIQILLEDDLEIPVYAPDIAFKPKGASSIESIAPGTKKSHGMRPVAWASEIVQQIEEINNQLINFNSGIGLSPVFGIDFKQEIPTVLGGKFLLR
uniref:Uncharacterized protein n=1 Tax=Ditylenchus dipsaci TaxID=166011 RepID=A0A915DW08_9BILA